MYIALKEFWILDFHFMPGDVVELPTIPASIELLLANKTIELTELDD